MNNELQALVNSIPEEDPKIFMSKTKSNVMVKKSSEKLTIDYSWVETIHDAIPYIDNIIRNPRRFIVQEEDILPIEKTKKISEESVKHLAQHTGLIQEIDEDGLVKPIKMLNIFKEETIDLYENRFIYSLIINLHTFVQNQLSYQDEESSSKEVKTVNYEANTRFKNEDINITLSLKSVNYEKLSGPYEKPVDLKQKIEYVRDILEDFMSSQFMKNMKNATPVRSPIRKTNIILKDTNFVYALRLWEFLERFQIEKPLRRYKESTDLSNEAIDKKYSLTYYLNYAILNGLEVAKDEDTSKYAQLKKIIFNLAKSFDTDDNEIKSIINNELKSAAKYKQKQIRGINETYKKFINNNFEQIEKVMLLLK